MPQRDPESLRKLEEVMFIEQIEDSRKTLDRELSEIRLDLAKRGLSHSGQYNRHEHEARTRHLERVVQARVQIRKDLAKQAPELLEVGELNVLLRSLEKTIEAHYQGRALNRDRINQTPCVPVRGANRREDIEIAGVLTLARRDVGKLKLLTKLGFTDAPERPTTLNIRNSTIGNLNLGNLVGDMNSTIEQLDNRGEQTVAESFKVLSEAVLQDGELGGRRKEILEFISGLAEQANLPPEQRKQGVIKSFCGSLKEGLSVVANLSAVWTQHGEAIIRYFGL